MPASGGLGVETRGPVTASEDDAIQVGIAEGKHPSVLVERPAPWHDTIQREHATILCSRGYLAQTLNPVLSSSSFQHFDPSLSFHVA